MSIMTNIITFALADAKAHLSTCVREVELGGTVLITRHGKPVAALVRPEDLDALERLRAAGPAGGLAGVAGGWPGSEDLVRALETRRRSASRRGPRLD